MDPNSAPQQGAPQGFSGGPPSGAAGGRFPGAGPGRGMMFLGPWGGIVSLVLLAVTYVVVAVAFWQFLKKAGLTPAIAVLMLVPVVNLGVALWAAFAEWPVLAENKRLKLLAASADAGLSSPTPSAVQPAPAPPSAPDALQPGQIG